MKYKEDEVPDCTQVEGKRTSHIAHVITITRSYNVFLQAFRLRYSRNARSSQKACDTTYDTMHEYPKVFMRQHDL